MISDLADMPPELMPDLVPHELWQDNVRYLIGWRKLQSIRPQGLNFMAALPPSEVEIWANYCWQGDQRQFVKRMLEVDAAWCEAVNEREAKKLDEQRENAKRTGYR